MAFTGKVPLLTTVTPDIHNGHWSFPEQMGGKDYAGFIYVIRDTVLERFYLGKKNYYGRGRTNKGVEASWKTYKSSSKALKHHFAERPYYDEFDFICIEQYHSQGTLSYSETWSLCLVEAPTSNTWYNRMIDKVTWNVSEQITNRHKERLEKSINWEQFQ